VSAAEILKQARSAGLRIVPDGEDLLLSASAAPASELLVMLARHKMGILLLLKAGGEQWSPDDWRAYLDERTAIREHDGGLAGAEVERLAFEDTVSRWLSAHPAPATPPDRCVHCRDTQRTGDVLLPMLAEGGHTWIHNNCWTEWYATRRSAAIATLIAMGVASAPAGEPL
jgi:hypothetical protein